VGNSPTNASDPSGLGSGVPELDMLDRQGNVPLGARINSSGLCPAGKQFGEEIGQAMNIVDAAATGVGHGSVITANVFTFEQFESLNTWADQLVATHGGLYVYSGYAATLARESLLFAFQANAANVLRGGLASHSAAEISNARQLMHLYGARDAYQALESSKKAGESFYNWDIQDGLINTGFSILGALGMASAVNSINASIAEEAALQLQRVNNTQMCYSGIPGIPLPGRVPVPINPYRKAGLPTRHGNYRFIPPKGSNPANPTKGPGKGFVDKFGNEWVKGPNHHFPGEGDFEWDVQLPGGGHLNVSITGKVVRPAGR
jgi:hypothetical protein